MRPSARCTSRANFAASSGAVWSIVAPLRGSTDWLPEGLLDERGMLRVDAAMAAGAGVFGIGDVVAVPDGYRLPLALRSIQSTAGGRCPECCARARRRRPAGRSQSWPARHVAPRPLGIRPARSRRPNDPQRPPAAADQPPVSGATCGRGPHGEPDLVSASDSPSVAPANESTGGSTHAVCHPRCASRAARATSPRASVATIQTR